MHALPVSNLIIVSDAAAAAATGDPGDVSRGKTRNTRGRLRACGCSIKVLENFTRPENVLHSQRAWRKTTEALIEKSYGGLASLQCYELAGHEHTVLSMPVQKADSDL